MAILDMFDKLDDIAYEPVKKISDWIGEPLKRFEHKRQLEMEEKQAEISAKEREQELLLEGKRDRQKAELEADVRRWNVEIDKIVEENEDARRDKLVESIKRYQIDLANATQSIIENIGKMSLSLREKANDLVQEKTKAYMEMQKEIKKESYAELQEAREMFFDTDPDTFNMLRDEIMEERKSMFDKTGAFITELAEDLKRLNANTDSLAKESMTMINEALFTDVHLVQEISSTGAQALLNENNNQEIVNSDIIDQ